MSGRAALALAIVLALSGCRTALYTLHDATAGEHGAGEAAARAADEGDEGERR